MFLGIDPVEARSFALGLRQIAYRVDQAGTDLAHAEMLSEVVTGVHGELASVATMAQRLATNILRASHHVEWFTIDVEPALTNTRGVVDSVGRVNIEPDGNQSHPLTKAHVGWAPLEPYLSRGLGDWSVGTSNREVWLDRTRLDPAAMRRYRAWGERYGIDEHASVMILSSYVSRSDRQVETNLGSTGTNEYMLRATALNSPEIMIETEARRQFLELELMAVEKDWTDEQRRVADLKALNFHLNEPVQGLYPDSSVNSYQLGVAFALMLAQNPTGADLPVLSDEELQFVVAVGTEDDQFSRLGNEILSVTAATSNLSSSNLAVGLRGLGTMVDGVGLLNALVEGDIDYVREKTSDIAAGSLIASAARWLLPRMVSGPVVTIAALVIALTQTGPPGEARPNNPPRTGWTDEFGRQISNGACMTASGSADRIACGG